ncbi:hypothetical protein ES332_A04G088200v1 [Gossypium tomentosum]|uniref:Uncharacterized protein n=1 Tax=Gossypium tomentosum TaxID=34277 RepID=A0A5D2QZK9_GOSTO|nr:hypothetical protein ES332_A04G088200v1 [Gossypium tomentosum]TYI32800.1 hypothetical protein ES332_A04G088200v1 [Gossypium tomentosum]
MEVSTALEYSIRWFLLVENVQIPQQNNLHCSLDEFRKTQVIHSLLFLYRLLSIHEKFRMTHASIVMGQSRNI